MNSSSCTVWKQIYVSMLLKVSYPVLGGSATRVQMEHQSSPDS